MVADLAAASGRPLQGTFLGLDDGPTRLQRRTGAP